MSMSGVEGVEWGMSGRKETYSPAVFLRNVRGLDEQLSELQRLQNRVRIAEMSNRQKAPVHRPDSHWQHSGADNVSLARRDQLGRPFSRLGARIRQFIDGLAVGIECFVLGPVVENQTIDVVYEGLRRTVFGENQRMIF